MKIIGIALSAILAFSGLAAYAQGQGQNRDYSKVEIKTTQLSGNLYLLEGAGGNIGASVGPDGVLIVDTQFLPLAEKINAALAKLDPSGSNRLQYVVNTHVHGDHTGGNAYFGKQARIVAQSTLRKRLAAKPEAKPEELPVITYAPGGAPTLQFNGEEVRIIAFGPGHTDGDSAVYFSQSKVVQLGDQFVTGRYPFVDVANGGDAKGFLKNLDSVLEWLPSDAKVIPGHGPISSVSDVRAFRDFVAESIRVVEQDIAAGKTLDQVKGNAFLERHKEWNNGGRWLEAIYNSLTRNSKA